MGRAQRLILENFKSYGDRLEVGPFLSFNCILGPNGSGKSNLVDALAFVLGIQARELRGANLQDLVHRKESDEAPPAGLAGGGHTLSSSSSAAASEGAVSEDVINALGLANPPKSVGSGRNAKISLEFAIDSEDAEQLATMDEPVDAGGETRSPRREDDAGALPPQQDAKNSKPPLFAGAVGKQRAATKPKSAGDLIVFGREICGKTGASQYLLDGKPCTQDVYFKSLSALRILTRARNFIIFQGDVEQLTAKQGLQLTAYLERVCESDRYREEYDLLEGKKKKSDDLVRYLFSKKRGAANEKKQLEEQKKEAEQFRVLQEEKYLISQEFFVFRLSTIEVGFG